MNPDGKLPDNQKTEGQEEEEEEEEEAEEEEEEEEEEPLKNLTVTSVGFNCTLYTACS
jgi:hypothetical protein